MSVTLSHNELLFQLKVRNDLIDQQAARIIELTERLNAFEAIRRDSSGVVGYHLNGDIATWDELLSPETSGISGDKEQR